MQVSSDWDSAKLRNDSSAWFVNTWDGRFAGSPECELLFAIEVPGQLCLAVRLFPKSEQEWQRRALSSLARTSVSPDYLLTDMNEMLPILVTFGASLETVATAHLVRL